MIQNALTLVPAVLATALGLAGLLLGLHVANRFNMPELADPSDHLAHLTVGVVALWAWLNRDSESEAARGGSARKMTSLPRSFSRRSAVQL
jgi:hypothetical protein